MWKVQIQRVRLVKVILNNTWVPQSILKVYALVKLMLHTRHNKLWTGEESQNKVKLWIVYEFKIWFEWETIKNKLLRSETNGTSNLWRERPSRGLSFLTLQYITFTGHRSGLYVCYIVFVKNMGTVYIKFDELWVIYLFIVKLNVSCPSRIYYSLHLMHY